MSLRPKTYLLIGFGVVLVAGLAFVAFRTDPIPVDLAAVSRGPMEITINADGKTRIREIYEIAAPITGTAKRSPVDIGDRVVAGETVVAVVEPAPPSLLDTRTRLQAEAAVREAEAALAVAESRVREAEEDAAHAKSQFDRVTALVDRGVSSLTSLEDATQALAVREAALAAARSNLRLAESSLARSRAALIEPTDPAVSSDSACCVEVRAPADGVVLNIEVESERPVSAGTTLLTVGDPSDLEITADLLSTDAVRVGAGARAIVDRWGGPEPLEARLRSIEPSAITKVSALGIEEQRVDALFDLVSPPETRTGLGHGFAVFLRIVEWGAEDVLQAPISALFRSGEGWAVFVYRDGRAARVPVSVGHRNDRAFEVLDGLDPGARVILHPSDEIADGVAVVERETL